MWKSTDACHSDARKPELTQAHHALYLRKGGVGNETHSSNSRTRRDRQTNRVIERHFSAQRKYAEGVQNRSKMHLFGLDAGGDAGVILTSKA